MSHRGAEGADSKTGDGAGILIQVPRDFFLMQGFSLPPDGQFGTGLLFLPQDRQEAKICEDILLGIIKEEGVSFIAKPFSLASLAAKVRDVLDGQKP